MGTENRTNDELRRLEASLESCSTCTSYAQLLLDHPTSWWMRKFIVSSCGIEATPNSTHCICCHQSVPSFNRHPKTHGDITIKRAEELFCNLLRAGRPSHDAPSAPQLPHSGEQNPIEEAPTVISDANPAFQAQPIRPKSCAQLPKFEPSSSSHTEIYRELFFMLVKHNLSGTPNPAHPFLGPPHTDLILASPQRRLALTFSSSSHGMGLASLAIRRLQRQRYAILLLAYPTSPGRPV